jgi:hypothetical protein
MAYKPLVAVYDACVLYPFHLRNLLVQCAADRLICARWSDTIHGEWMRNLVANTPTLPLDALKRTRDLMNSVLPDANVSNYEQYIDAIELPDPDDRHVVAAGIAARASLIVTWNIRDFPARELARHGLRKQTPDALLMDLYARASDVVVAGTANARRNLTKSSISAVEFVKMIDNQKLHRFAKALATHMQDL